MSINVLCGPCYAAFRGYFNDVLVFLLRLKAIQNTLDVSLYCIQHMAVCISRMEATYVPDTSFTAVVGRLADAWIWRIGAWTRKFY